VIDAAAAPGAPRRFRFAPLLAATVLTVLLLWLFGSVADVLLLLFLAILLSLFLGAVADAITRRSRLPRRLALLVAVLLTLTAVTGLVWLLVPPVVEQTQALLRVFPAYVGAWEQGIYDVVRRVPGLAAEWRPERHRLLEAIYEQGATLFADVVPKVISIGHAAINVVSVGVMSLYLALQPDFYREWLIALFPPVHRDLVRDVLGDLGVTLRSWIVGQLLGMFILAALTAAGLYLLGVPYWLTFGVCPYRPCCRSWRCWWSARCSGPRACWWRCRPWRRRSSSSAASSATGSTKGRASAARRATSRWCCACRRPTARAC
jgi:predicted PurR-regulated permease PerM